MRLVAVVRRLHLYVGILLGIQVFLWMLSGVIMSWYDIDLVRGTTHAPISLPVELEATAYASPGGIIAQSEGVYSLELKAQRGRPVYITNGFSGQALFDARDGSPIEIDEEFIRAAARREFVGEASITSVTLLDDPPHEYRGSRPVWRADFDDDLATRIYFSAQSGEVASRRNKVWRLYDFFWMLHIMDYDERTDFNNPLIKAASLGGVLFALSGLFMIFFRSSRQLLIHDFRVLFRRNRQAK